MKIEEIQIENFRGIVKFTGDLKGNSAVFSGENGTGKSGVIDAIDFALSGKVRRLTGEGSKGLSLKDHATHVDKEQKSSFVQMLLSLPNGARIKVKRSISKGILELIEGTKENLELLEKIVGKGQYILSRRELLRFIACESGKRSEEIQELLDLSDADKIREDLASSQRKIEKALNDAQARKDNEELGIDNVLGIKAPSNTWQIRLEKINALREILKGEKIPTFAHDTNFLEGIVLPEKTTSSQVTKKSFTDAIAVISLTIPLNITDTKEKDPFDAFQKCSESILKSANFTRAIEEFDLVSKGLDLILPGDKCPLCDNQWHSAGLDEHLRNKKNEGKKAKDLKDDFERLSRLFQTHISNFSQKLSSLAIMLEKIDSPQIKAKIDSWIKVLGERHKNAANLADIVVTAKGISSDKKVFLSFPEDFNLLEKDLLQLIELLPEESKEQKVYKDLVSLDQFYKKYSENAVQYKKQNHSKNLITKMTKSYEKARSAVFEKLYKGIQTDFAKYYAFLNSEDEANFSAELNDKGNSLEMKVGFYGRGMFPPNAFHSEGHQDSMGICIFLALMKWLKADGFTISLLDDVMMSIDTRHRKKLCDLLQAEFKATQFIITTHDKIWANQLKKFNVVNPKNAFMFRSWSVETGPIYDNKTVWDKIDEALNNNSVSEAAATLRKLLEHEFHDICGNMEAPVTYTVDHSWDLGELKAASITQFKKYIKRGKAVANKWKKQEDEKRLQEIEARINAALKEANIHEWEVNRIVHHNGWENFSANELRSTVKAMKTLTESFVCPTCSQMYGLSTPTGKYEPDSFGCICSKFSLIEKV